MTSLPTLAVSPRTKELLQRELQVTAGGFEPVPAFFERGKGSLLWDVDGKEYIDFIAMFSAVNLGHCHPYLVQKVTEQLQKVALVNISGHYSETAQFSGMLCRRFGYDKVFSTTSGTEAADTACKIARKWGITRKNINQEDCLVLGVGGNYHGLGQGVWGLMDKSSKRSDYGLDSQAVMNYNPKTGEHLAYLDLKAMERALETNHLVVAAVIMEVIHGTSRNFQDEVDYAKGLYELCKKHNVLFIADEVRQGAGKTGKFFSFQHVGGDVKPDIVTMGKSITGGFYPQSFVLGTEDVMSVVGRWEMGSTYGFTPVGIAAATAAIQVIDDEKLMERAKHLGDLWVKTVTSWNHPKVDYVACIGADSNLILRDVSAERIAALCMHRGVFLFPRPDGLRISFAMTMSDEVLLRGAEVVRSALNDVDKFGVIEGETWLM